MNRHLQESQNKYDLHTNTTILSRRLCVYFACYLCLFPSSFFVNATTTKIVNFDEWLESFESFLSVIRIFLKLWMWTNKHINQTYFERYEFDVSVVLVLIATCTYKSMLNWVRMNQSSCIPILVTHSYSIFHKHLRVAKKRFTADIWYTLPLIAFTKKKKKKRDKDSKQRKYTTFYWVL